MPQTHQSLGGSSGGLAGGLLSQIKVRHWCGASVHYSSRLSSKIAEDNFHVSLNSD